MDMMNCGMLLLMAVSDNLMCGHDEWWNVIVLTYCQMALSEYLMCGHNELWTPITCTDGLVR